MKRKRNRRRGGTSEDQLLNGIRQVVSQYPNAPADIAEYRWMLAPRYWDRLAVPRGHEIEPRHEDRHGGVSFRVGWSEADRVVGVWIL